MQTISEDDVRKRIALENPWWSPPHEISELYRNWSPRPYLNLFLPRVIDRSVRRAIVLMGPRRVGKTVLIHHTIKELIAAGIDPKKICYFSVDSPIYNTLGLEKLLAFYGQATDSNLGSDEVFIFFDEIQYLKQWEVHLKALVDAYPNVKAVVSGSAAAALKLKSDESGAGRFSDFLLPPLTFYEYLNMLGQNDLLDSSSDQHFTTSDIEKLNEKFVHYLNFGGYPEAVFSPQVQADPGRFIKSDIIDKVLLRDLPSLYGISDIQELNYLFTTLAFNTAGELSLEELSQNSGVAKNTIKKYIEYLQAAFLIKVIHRVDFNSRKFKRANYFKVYLTNPSMRAALFSPAKPNDPVVPHLAETAIFAQWFHSEAILHYARWKDGEVDMVMLATDSPKPRWAIEVKWSDRYCNNPGELKGLLDYCAENKLEKALVTSKTLTASCKLQDVTLDFTPASIYCYTVGYNIIKHKLHPARYAANIPLPITDDDIDREIT